VITTAKLGFEPRFHRYVEHDEVRGWIVAIPPFGSVMPFAGEIGAEQRQIEAEGGVIIVADLQG
jgi:hypothetical protein